MDCDFEATLKHPWRIDIDNGDWFEETQVRTEKRSFSGASLCESVRVEEGQVETIQSVSFLKPLREQFVEQDDFFMLDSLFIRGLCNR